MNAPTDRMQAAVLRPREDLLRLREGIVAALNDDGTVDVVLDGTTIAEVVTVGHVADGDNVWMLQQRGDLLAVGSPTASRPGGLIASASPAASQLVTTTAETTLTGFTTVATVPAGRRVRALVSVPVRYGVGEIGQVRLRIKADGTEIAGTTWYGNYISNERWVQTFQAVHTPAGGSVTYSVTAELSIGTANVRYAEGDGWLVVEDLGAA